MDLAQLQHYLDGLGPSLTLSATDANLPAELQALLASTPATAINVQVGTGGIVLSGQTLTISGSCSDSWPIQGLAAATVQLASAQVAVTDAVSVTATATLKGTLPLAAGASAPVVVTPTSPASWSIALDGAAPGVTPTQLFEFGTGTSLPFPIPPKLNLFDEIVSVDPAGFVIRFTPNSTADAYFGFLVSSTAAAWPLIPGVIDFNGISLRVVLTTKAWSATIIGHVTVGTIAMDIGVRMSESTIWSAYVAPTTGATFPGIVELANWIASGGTLGQETAQGFSNLALNPAQFDLALASVTLSFDRVQATVVSLDIASRLTVVGLGLDLVLGLPNISLVGSLAGGNPVKVVDMLTAAGLSTADVPPALTIAAVDFSAQPSAGQYSADVEVDGIWTSGPVQLKSVKATVAYDSPPGSSSGDSPFTGQFVADIGIGATAVLELAAEYGGTTQGWTFSGTTPPGSSIAIGDVIAELAQTWNVKKSAVPAAVQSLALTNLDVSYQTGSSKFFFTCEGDFTVDATPVAVVFTIDVEPATAPATGNKATFGGTVRFANNQFDLTFDTESTGIDIFVADYVETKPSPTPLHDLVAAISADVAAAIPPGISVDLQEVKFVFFKDTTNLWAFGLKLGAGINLNELPIVGSKLPANETLAVQNLQLFYSSAVFTATQAGLVNGVLPDKVSKLPTAGVGAGIAFDADLTLGSSTKHVHFGANPPASGSPALTLGAPRALGVGAGAPNPAPASAADPIKWFDVSKQLGVFNFRRVGVGYQDNVLEFALDASVALGPLAFSMDGLTVGSPLTSFEPVFGLSGLSLSFQRPPITIAGSFLKVAETVNGKPVTSYYGELVAQVSQFGLKAVGGWTPDTGSFFLYASIDVPLGGPPFLFVTGLAGGFGINTRLHLPTIDEVSTYVLLPSVAPPLESTPGETIATVLDALQHTITPEVGQYWVAAGISFTSFEMIQAQAVVSVGFGVDVQIGVVGTCSMTFPTGDPYPVAYIEIDVVASFTPSTGLLSIDGKLNPSSFLFGGFVKLSGGFAFYVWFGGSQPGADDHKGEFVVTIGGYHPAFDKPTYYPAVPRLQMAFALGPLNVTGQAYFALTPSAFMAGARLSAVFSLGPIKAWFDAGVDFLISWAPFHYEAHAFVSIGCSLDLGLFTISLHIGADLEIWGPAFGGRAVVDLDIVSFTISFGAAQNPPPPIGWSSFRSNFLPADTNGTTTRPSVLRRTLAAPFAGAALAAAAPARPSARATPAPTTTNIIQATVEAGKRAAGTGGVDWIIDPDAFRFLTSSTIPANNGEWATAAAVTTALPNDVSKYTRAPSPPTPAPPGGPVPAGMALQLSSSTVTASATLVWTAELDIGPMDEHAVQSFHTVALTKRDSSGSYDDYVTGVTVEPVLTPSNTALWLRKPDDPTPNDKRLIPATLTGFRISPVPRKPVTVSGVPLLDLIYGPGKSTGFAFPTPVIDTDLTVSSSISGAVQTINVGGTHTAMLTDNAYVLNSLADTWVSGQRSAVLTELRANGFTTTEPTDVDVSIFSSATALVDWPIVAVTGGRQ